MRTLSYKIRTVNNNYMSICLESRSNYNFIGQFMFFHVVKQNLDLKNLVLWIGPIFIFYSFWANNSGSLLVYTLQGRGLKLKSMRGPHFEEIKARWSHKEKLSLGVPQPVVKNTIIMITSGGPRAGDPWYKGTLIRR